MGRAGAGPPTNHPASTREISMTGQTTGPTTGQTTGQTAGQTTGQQRRERRSARAMVAAIALAAGVPMPTGVRFYGGPEAAGVSLSFDRLADGQAWSTFLGGQTDTYVYQDRRYLHAGVIRW